MRGAPAGMKYHLPFLGIIPADAGSTHHLQAHPVLAVGSSPQMRGAPWRVADIDHAPGIIPADAGSTMAASLFLSTAADHPRRCGEHYNDGKNAKPDTGSSPQMRGARVDAGLVQQGEGIIPADAGSTEYQG